VCEREREREKKKCGQTTRSANNTKRTDVVATTVAVALSHPDLSLSLFLSLSLLTFSLFL